MDLLLHMLMAAMQRGPACRIAGKTLRPTYSLTRALERRRAADRGRAPLDSPPRISFDHEATTFELEQHGRSAVAVLPTAVERLRHLGECHTAQLAASQPRSAMPAAWRVHGEPAQPRSINISCRTACRHLQGRPGLGHPN